MKRTWPVLLLSALALLFGCSDRDAGGARGGAGEAPSATAPRVTPDSPPAPDALATAVSNAVVSPAGATLSARPHLPRTPVDALPFTRRQGNEVGIDTLGLFTPDQFSPPFINGRGMAGGDYDRDGLPDIVIATRRGIQLFHNESGLLFTEQPVEVPQIRDLDVFTVAFVDIDRDGWLDLFLTSYTTGNHIVFNDRGRYEARGWHRVEPAPTVLTTAIAFGDIDQDGDLDAYAGNWYYGADHQIPPEDSTNQLLINEGGRFRVQPMAEIVGETLSVLLSDFDLDDDLDLIVGNDFGPPDIFYFGDGRGGFRMIQSTEEIIRESTESTMSIDTADYDNDLDLDIYIAQIADGVPGVLAGTAPFRKQSWTAYCDELNRASDREQCLAGVRLHQLFESGESHRPEHVERCARVASPMARKQCETEMTLITAVRTKQPDLCDQLPGADAASELRCRLFFKPGKHGTDEEYVEAIRQVREENVLLRANGRGRFDNVAAAAGVHITGWSWNALFMDLDDDEWQDIYVVNGTWLARDHSTQKFFFRNLGGKRFEEASDAFGLQSFMVQSAYVSFDMEGDGDLDLLVNGIHGPFWLYRNNEAENNSVSFELRDERANRDCVGCKVRIYYGANAARAQLREVKLGGGYHSFNPTRLHFGLGAHGVIDRVEVTWSTGEVTKVEGRLPANALYTLTRNGEPLPGGGASLEATEASSQ